MNAKVPKGEQVASSPIFKKFLATAEEYLNKPLRVKQLLNDAYQKARQKNELGSLAHEAWETVQTLIRLVRSSASGEYTGLPTATIVAAVAVLVYFLSPIDVIPDFIPVLGLLDDVALVAWFSSTLKEQLDNFVEWEATRPVVVADAKTGDVAPAPATTFAGAADGSDYHHEAASSAVGQEANESAKKSSPTDSGNDADATPSHSDVGATTTSGSRQPNVSGLDTGGNIR